MTNIDVHWHIISAEVGEGIISGRIPVAGTVDTSGDVPVVAAPYGFRLRLQEKLLDSQHAIDALDVAGLDIATPSLAPPLRQYDAEPDDALAVLPGGQRRVRGRPAGHRRPAPPARRRTAAGR